MHSAARQMQVLPPALVPSEEDLKIWRGAVGSLIHPEGSVTEVVTVSQAVAALHEALSILDEMEPPVSLSPGREDDAAHDAYFQMSRVAGDNATVMIRAICQVRLFLMEEVAGPGLAGAEATWRVIDRSLISLLVVLLQQEGKVSSPITMAEPDAAPTMGAMTRWIGGHQIFAALTQGLIFSMGCVAGALRAGDMDAVARHAELSIHLLQGSAGAFRFTGEFLPDEYSEIIRPSMMPPATPMCLSGLMSVDHRYLVQQIREMQPALKRFRQQNPTCHDALAAALNGVYDAHIHVCERFVGDQPSIRTAESTDKSGPALLQQFRNLRLKPFRQT